MRGRTVPALAALAVAGLALTGCGEKVEERSFTDRHGRVCTYVVVKEWDGGKDVGNISCEFSPSAPGTGPSPAPSTPR